MPTTSLGIRYPASSAAPNVPQDLQNLATDVNNLIDPLTWTGLSTLTGWATGTPAPQYAKDASGRVWLRGVVTNLSTFTPAADLMVNVLPTGFRPTGDVILPVFTSGTVTAFVRVTATGRVEAFRSHGNTSIGANAGWSLDSINFPTN